MIQRALCPVLVGRDAELTALEEGLVAAHRGEGGMSVLAGDAGMGKSRLAIELQVRATRLGMAVMRGGCSEADLSLPYLPVFEALGNHLARADLDDVRRRLGAARHDLGHLFPQLADDRAVSDAGDPLDAKVRFYEAILALLGIAAGSKGLLLVVEDLHWADASTRELADYLTRRVRTTPIHVLATYRKDEMHRRHPLLPIVQGWRRSELATIVELEPMSPEQVAAMVCAIFDEASISDEFRDLLHERSEGNPFVLEELLKDAIDRGDVYRTATGWDRKSLAELRIPRSVADTILLRVERLQPEHADVLRAAAVLGRSFDYPVLAAVTGFTEELVIAGLEECVRQQLLEEDEQPGWYRFRHALTREAVYGELVQPRRVQLHSRAADALAGRSDLRAVDVAHHLLAANRFSDAVPVCLTAAAQAAQARAYLDAAELYERALPHAAGDAQRGQVLGALGEALHQANQPARAQDHLIEAVRLLEVVGDTTGAARSRLVLGRCMWEAGRPREAREQYEQARQDLEPAGPSHDLAVAYIRIGGLHIFDLEYAQTQALMERAIEIAELAGSDAARIWAYNFLGSALAGQGRPDEGFKWSVRGLREAVALDLAWIGPNAFYNLAVRRVWMLRAAEALGQWQDAGLMPRRSPADGPWILFCEGYVVGALGELRRSAEISRQAMAISAEVGHRVQQARSGAQLALALAEMGETEEAVAVLDTLVLGAERQDVIYYGPAVIRVALDTGRHESAIAMAQRVLETRSYLHHTTWPLACAVEAFVAAGDLKSAQAVVDEGDGGDMDRDDAHMRQAAGRLALARGELGAAAAHLGMARDGYAAARYAVHELHTRLLLAQALLGLGDRDGAVGELRATLEGAAARGARPLADAARRRLEELGEEEAAAVAAGGLDDGVPAVAVPVGERLVTVLFADVRGYTRLTAAAAPADTAARIAALQRTALRAVERHHGVVDKFAGDAVMATFNVSGASVDHTVHALEAALTIIDTAALEGLPVGAGIAVGPAIVGRLADGANLSVLGETTNVAARLVAAAGAGEIILTAEAFRRAAARLDELSLEACADALDLKGIDSPVEVRRVTTGAAAPRGT